MEVNSLNQLIMSVFAKVIYLRVWQKRTGLRVVVGEVTRGHLRSSCKVISRDKGDLTKNFNKFVSGIIGKVIYLGV